MASLGVFVGGAVRSFGLLDFRPHHHFGHLRHRQIRHKSGPYELAFTNTVTSSANVTTSLSLWVIINTLESVGLASSLGDGLRLHPLLVVSGRK